MGLSWISWIILNLFWPSCGPSLVESRQLPGTGPCYAGLLRWQRKSLLPASFIEPLQMLSPDAELDQAVHTDNTLFSLDEMFVSFFLSLPLSPSLSLPLSLAKLRAKERMRWRLFGAEACRPEA